MTSSDWVCESISSHKGKGLSTLLVVLWWVHKEYHNQSDPVAVIIDILGFFFKLLDHLIMGSNIRIFESYWKSLRGGGFEVGSLTERIFWLSSLFLINW